MRRTALEFCKWDLIAVTSVVLMAVVVFLLFLPAKTEPAAYAQIYLNGQLVKTVSLREDGQFTVTGAYSSTIAVCDGKIAVVSSDCPGADCVACGWIDSCGRSIVCLPNGLEIRVVSEKGDVDFIVG